MIGIKTKNQLLGASLVELWPDKMELFNKKHTYSAVIKDFSESQPEAVPVLYLGKDLPFPFSLNQLDQALALFHPSSQNLKNFYWKSSTKELISKKTNSIFHLTQKEAELIDFLSQSPKHQATKEELLEHVWHYHENAHTHTPESHLYALKQKLGKEACGLIKHQKNIFILL